MQLRLRMAFLLSLLSFLFIALFLSAAGAGEIRIGGTGGALGLMKRLGAEYQRTHPSVVVTVVPSLGSTGGIKALIAGALDITVSSRPLNEKESGLVSQDLGRTPFVFAVAKGNSLTGISLTELPDLYSGSKTWKDGRPSRVVLRPEAEYDTELLKSMSPELGRAVTAALTREGMIIAVTDQDSANAVEKIPGAIGTTTLGQIITEDRRLKPLVLDGVKPGLETLDQGAYPYAKSYYLISRPAAAPEIMKFLEFVHSPDARQVMARSGYQAAGR